MDNDFYKVIFGIIKIIILILATIGIIGYVFVKNHGERVVKSWSVNRQHPAFMPFAGILGKNTNNNSITVFKHYFGNNFATLISPMHYILNLYNTVFNKLFNDLNVFRVYLVPIRLFFFNMAKMFYQELDNMLSVSAYLFVKIRDMLKRVASTFQLTLLTFKTILLSIESIWHGPIGVTAEALGYIFSPLQGILNTLQAFSFSCVHPDTFIKLLNNNYQKIKDIQLGQYVGNDNKIYGLIYNMYNKNYMYRVGQDLFTENHLIYSKVDLKWKRASDLGTKTNTDNNYICCPLTTKHYLYTNNNLLIRDYEEYTKHKLELIYLTRLCQKLEIDIQSINHNIIDSYAGFGPNTPINFNNNNQTLISTININDIVNISGQITGVCKQINNSYWIKVTDDIMVTPRQLIYYQSKWMFADNLPKSFPRVSVSLNNNIQYSLITKNHFINISKYQFIDYTELMTDNIHSDIILNYLNTEEPNTT